MCGRKFIHAELGWPNNDKNLLDNAKSVLNLSENGTINVKTRDSIEIVINGP